MAIEEEREAQKRLYAVVALMFGLIHSNTKFVLSVLIILSDYDS